jgi:hypothetical protein
MPQDAQRRAVERLHASRRRRAVSDVELILMRVIVRAIAVLCAAAWLWDAVLHR